MLRSNAEKDMPADLLAAPPPEEVKAREGGGALVAGGVLAGLGLAAITFPFLATLALEIVVAGLIGASGVVQLYQAFVLSRAPRALLRGASGLLWLAAGVIFLVSPLAGETGSLRLWVAGLLAADGVFRLVQAARLRGRERGWVWLALSGGSTIVLAGLIAAGLPTGFYWTVGLLLGVTLVIDGAGLIVAWRAQRSSEAAPLDG
jgi:uncharacterized membrane protein HdeD (DUF308 family)